jgi:IS1 family transposase
MYTKVCDANQVLSLMIEGMSISAIERHAGMNHNTILSLLKVAGKRCEQLLCNRIQNIQVEDVQCDEIWGFVQKKEAHKWPWEAHDDKRGDAYCFVAIERNTKLVLAHRLGRPTDEDTEKFAKDVRRATAPQRFQITTDGFKPYIRAFKTVLADRVDFAQLVKVYAVSQDGERRYSPPDVVEAVPYVRMGDPDESKICTSHVERQNLTIRMQMRRMTRLTNGFSKKWENLKAAYAVHFAYYNFCRRHSTLKNHARYGGWPYQPSLEYWRIAHGKGLNFGFASTIMRRFHMRISISVILLLTLGAFAGMAQAQAPLQVSPTSLTFTTPVGGIPAPQLLTVGRLYVPGCDISTAKAPCPAADEYAIDPVTGYKTYFALAGTLVPASVGGVVSYNPVVAGVVQQWTLLAINNAYGMLNGSGTTPSSISVFIIPPSTLGAGTYDGIISLISGGSPLAVIPVILTITPPDTTFNRVGVFSHFAAGAGWTSVMTLVNTSSTTEPVTVNLHGDDGSSPSFGIANPNPAILPITTTQHGVSQTATASSVSLTLGPNETALLSMGDQLTTNIEGWADVLSPGTLSGFEIFRWNQNNTVSEGTVPLQTQFPPLITIPYDDTNNFFMGVALTTLSPYLAPVTAIMFDENGNQLGTQSLTLPPNGHTSFLLANQFPLTAGKLGNVQFKRAATPLVGIGLRFEPSGTFTSVPTM